VQHALSDLVPIYILNHTLQDSQRVLGFVAGIVRAFLVKHGFTKNRIDITCEERISGMLNTSLPTEERERDREEAQLTIESPFVMNAPGPTKCRMSQPSIDLIEYMKHDGATIICAVCASVA
jgi:hypothetical protein